MLLREIIRSVAPKDGEVIVDGTFGAGGYTRALLAAADCRVIAIDRDPQAIAAGAELARAMGGRLTLVHGRFSRLDMIVGDAANPPIGGVLLDIGVSSMQIDDVARGFSFRGDAPLDMRMEQAGESAADLVARLPEATLARVLAVYGEERHARRLARALVAARAEAPIATTGRLAEIVARIVRSKPGDIHPATRTFQALRIAVNDELNELAQALLAAERVLAPGGRLAVVTFHSLEDRIVKTFLTDRARTTSGGSRHAPDLAVAPPTFALDGRKPIEPAPDEVAANPRARSARLRVATRLAEPARGTAPAADWVPDPFARATGRGR